MTGMVCLTSQISTGDFYIQMKSAKENFVRRWWSKGEKQKCFMCFALCKSIHGSVALIWIKWSIIMAPLCLQWIWGKEFLRNARHCYTPRDIKLDEKSSKIDEWSYSFLNEMVSFSLLFYKVFNEEKVTLKNTVTIPFPEDA